MPSLDWWMVSHSIGQPEIEACNSAQEAVLLRPRDAEEAAAKNDFARRLAAFRCDIARFERE
jgi:hypothetical protein